MASKKKAMPKTDFEKALAAGKKLKADERSKLATQLLPGSIRRQLEEHWWPKETRDALGLGVPVTFYAQDPSVAKKNANLLDQDAIPWENGLSDGPTSSRLAVVDYNADTDRVEPPAKWNADEWRFEDASGRPLDSTNTDSPQFHQVNTWAVVTRVLNLFEDSSALGRRIPWGFQGNRMIIVPHAGFDQNAFYDRDSKSLQFYYFGSAKKPVYTCLSHDIIAHETGHSILDGVRPYYMELDSFEGPAFHEFVADLSAILTAFRNNDVRQAVAAATKGDLRKDQLVAHIAQEFGEQAIGRPYLRSALNKRKMKDVGPTDSPHDCSEVLTGAMFSVLTDVVANYMHERGKSDKQALWFGISRFIRVAAQALDYCPPAGVTFADYACAVLRRDILANPLDPHGHRARMRKWFDERGILPKSKTPETLKEGEEPDYSDFFCFDIKDFVASPASAYGFVHERRRRLMIPADQDFEIADPYTAEKVRRRQERRPTEIVLQYVWTEDVVLEERARFGSLAGEVVPLICGGTLVYDDEGNLLYWSYKPGTRSFECIRSAKGRAARDQAMDEGRRRRERLLEYVESCVSEGLIGVTEGGMFDDVGVTRPVVAERVGSHLRLRVSSHLRHWPER